MIAPAAKPAAAIAAPPPTRATRMVRPPRSSVAGPPDRPQAVRRERPEDDGQDHGPRGEQRDLRRVADGDRVGHVGDRADDGHDQEDRRRARSVARRRVPVGVPTRCAPEMPGRRVRSVMPVPPRRCGGRWRGCRTRGAGSSGRPAHAPPSPNASSRNPRAASMDSNVHQQCTTRTLKPWLRNGPVAPAPRAVLGQLAAQARDVVASVVVDHEQSAAGPQQPPSLRRPDRGRRPGTPTSTRRPRRRSHRARRSVPVHSSRRA